MVSQIDLGKADRSAEDARPHGMRRRRYLDSDARSASITLGASGLAKGFAQGPPRSVDASLPHSVSKETHARGAGGGTTTREPFPAAHRGRTRGRCQWSTATRPGE